MLGAYHTLFPELPVEPRAARWRERYLTARAMGVCGAVLGLCLVLWIGGASWASWRLTGDWRYSEEIPKWRSVTLQEWLQQARQRVIEGEFQRALGTVRYALSLAPNDLSLLNFKGDMYESLFEFEQARQVYDQVLKLSAGNRHAQENLTFCQRAIRFRDRATVPLSTVYGLHRIMLAQGRVDEALHVGKRLDTDHTLLRATWQAALDRTRLPGKITVDSSGGLSLDLAGVPHPDLALISEFPLVGLNLAFTGVEDIEPLRGMLLEKLDLSGTLVYDLSPLRTMPLQTLRLPGTGVVNLSDLARCPLQELDISRTRIGDLTPLANLPLTTLRADDTLVADIRPLAALPLSHLSLSRTKVTNLQPLEHLPLEDLALENTGVTDLSPLRGATLRELYLSSTRISDLTPLAGMPLKVLTLSSCAQVKDLRPLTSCPELEHLRVPPNLPSLDALANLPHLRFVQRDGVKS